MNDGDNRSGAFDLANARMRLADEKRMEELNRELARHGRFSDTRPRCDLCSQLLKAGSQATRCTKCRNRVNTAKRRATAAAKLKAHGIEVKT